MALIINAPRPFVDAWNKFSVFLAGSIEMGAAENWQEIVENGLLRFDNIALLNPRRDDWDSSWEQSADNPQFRQQVEWELSAMEAADMITMYFSPQTMSPISLLEFGLFARSGKLVVCCPHGFWRKGNVDITCDMYSVERVNSLQDLINAIIARSISFDRDYRFKLDVYQ